MATLTASQVYSVARQAGASHDEAITLTAIAKGESGWNTGAHNPKPPDNSYGLWQINMLGDMGASRRQQFGIASNEALFNPITNAAAALAILRGQGWNAWSVYSNGSYKNYLGEATAAGNASVNTWSTLAKEVSKGNYSTSPVVATSAGDVDPVTGQTALPPNATPEQIEGYVLANYPQVAGFLGIPEIRGLLIQAAQEAWAPGLLQGKIQATNWWRTNGEAARNYFALQATDPQSLKELIAAKVAEIGPQMRELGVTDNIDFIAEGALKYGWTPDQMKQMFAASLTTLSEREGLTEGSTPEVDADRIMAIARTEYFLPVSRQDAERWAIDIYAGNKTEEQIRDYFARISAARFPGLKEQGFTPGEYMAPIRQAIADALEVSAAQVDFLNPIYAPVLEVEGQNGMRPMSLAEAGKWARSLPQFKTTKGALDQAASLGSFIGQTFGAVA